MIASVTAQSLQEVADALAAKADARAAARAAKAFENKVTEDVINVTNKPLTVSDVEPPAEATDVIIPSEATNRDFSTTSEEFPQYNPSAVRPDLSFFDLQAKSIDQLIGERHHKSQSAKPKRKRSDINDANNKRQLSI